MLGAKTKTTYQVAGHEPQWQDTAQTAGNWTHSKSQIKAVEHERIRRCRDATSKTEHLPNLKEHHSGNNLPLVSREWKNGSNSSYNCTPFLHSLLTDSKASHHEPSPNIQKNLPVSSEQPDTQTPGSRSLNGGFL